MSRILAVSPATGEPTPPNFVHTVDGDFVDSHGNTLLFRGANLSSLSKAPVGQPSYLLDGFWESAEAGENSFISRPLNLEDGSADVHLVRLRGRGFNILRYPVTWEDLEHEGPGIYDYDFMDYTIRVLRKCKEYGFRVYMDPHQEIWSRHCGGSGAPYWTLAACGMNPRNFTILHNEFAACQPDPASVPAMTWSTNFLAPQTLFTLFFAGRDFAPNCIIDGRNIQDYLQFHYIEAFGLLADRIRDAGDLLDDCVIGWDSMNEPSEGLVGYPDLHSLPAKQGSTLKSGLTPTPAQSLRLGMGQAQTVENWALNAFGLKRARMVTIDPKGLTIWLDPSTERDGVHPRYGWKRGPDWQLGVDIWALHGVWDIETGYFMRPDYFRYLPTVEFVGPEDELAEVVFAADYWAQHWQAWARRIRRAHPEAIHFVSPPVSAQPPPLPAEDLAGRCAYSAHYRDGLPLVTRQRNWFNAGALGLLGGKYKDKLQAPRLGEGSPYPTLQIHNGMLSFLGDDPHDDEIFDDDNLIDENLQHSPYRHPILPRNNGLRRSALYDLHIGGSTSSLATIRPTTNHENPQLGPYSSSTTIQSNGSVYNTSFMTSPSCDSLMSVRTEIAEVHPPGHDHSLQVMSVEQPSWSEIYREQLSSLNHGLALWDPNPVVNLHKKPGHVSIGDVGYLDKGAFIRMFNVTLPWDDPSNMLHGKPEQYEHIKPGYNVRDYEIREGGHYTPHVSEGDNFRANTHEDSMGQMYQCKARYRGALLSLPHEAHCKDVILMKVFEDYTKNNVDNWFRWSRKMKLPVENMEDLILVTGCTLVASWAAAAFDAHMSVDSDATTISLEARNSDGGGTQFFWRNIRGTVDYRNSHFNPNVQEPLPRNQCVFIRGFRAKRTLFRIKSMRAGAEPLPHDPNNRREDEIQVTQIPDSSKYRDPVVGILDYIIQKSNEDISAAEDVIAIAHDDDLQLIEGVEALTADTIEKFLHKKQMPLIVRDGSAILRDPADNKPPVSHDEKNKRRAPTDTPFEIYRERLSSMGPALATVSHASIPAPHLSRSYPNGYQNQSYTPIPFGRSEGSLTKMFGRRDAAFFIESLLKVEVRDVYLIGNVPGWHSALMSQRPSIHDARVDAINPNNRQPLWLLDVIPQPMYHVVPQRIWTPPNQSDWRRYVEQARLRMPVFLIQNDGAIGLPLTRALAGDRALLRYADLPAPLDGGFSTLIRIAWPRYELWERQIQTRDQTRQRNEITLERFVKLVAGVVDRFLTAAASIAVPDSPWRVGHGGINRTKIVLVGAVQVSAGRWMPILQVYNPIATPTWGSNSSSSLDTIRA